MGMDKATTKRREDLLLREVPWKAILFFALPIYFSVLFSQGYGFLEGYWLSNGSHEAFTAVSLSGYFVYFGTTFASGLSTGVTNVTAQRFGEGKTEKVRQSIALSFVLCLFAGIAISLLMCGLVEPLLDFGNVPAGAIREATKTYLFWIFGASLIGISLQNLVVSLFRSFGAKRESFYVSVFYVLLNTLLDFLFLVVGNLSVLGVGLAYALSQFLAFLFGLAIFHFRFPDYRLHPADFHFGKSDVAAHAKSAFYYAGQCSVIGVGLFFLQRSLNTFGSTAIVGYSLANRLFNYLGIFEAALSSSLMYFSAQNRGKGDGGRVKAGLRHYFYLSAILGLIALGIGFLFKTGFFNLFFDSKDHPEMFRSYSTTLLFFLPSFFLTMTLNGFRCLFFGVSRPAIAFVSTVVEALVRVLFALVITPSLGFYGVPLSDVVAWGATSAFCVVAYFVVRSQIYAPSSLERPQPESSKQA